MIDGEGSFMAIIHWNNEQKKVVQVFSVFQISLHKRDLPLLLQLQNYFGGIGFISKSKTQNIVKYSIKSIKDLTNILIPHFDKYPLLTQKSADFILFKQIVELLKNKEHFSLDGLHKIINIKASMNLGLSEVLKSNFIKFKPVDRPLILTNNIPNAKWLSGFVSGEGNFDVSIIHNSKQKLGYQVKLRFRISQHVRDLKLMELLINYLGAGRIELNSSKSIVSLTIVKFSDLNNKIIPFLEKNTLHGVKILDFLDFCAVAKLMNEGKHLTIEGLELIRTIKSKMNTNRKLE